MKHSENEVLLYFQQVENSNDQKQDKSKPKLIELIKEKDDITIEDQDEDSDETETLEEDDMNTIDSNGASKRGKKKKQIVLPKFTRYQMMIQLNQEDKDPPIAENSTSDQNPPHRVR